MFYKNLQLVGHFKPRVQFFYETVHKNFSLSFVSSNSSDPTDRKFVAGVDNIIDCYVSGVIKKLGRFLLHFLVNRLPANFPQKSANFANNLEWLRLVVFMQMSQSQRNQKPAKMSVKKVKWMRFSRMVIGSDCKCTRFNSPEFNSSILRHSEI
jgi:hypothetical protein